MKGSNYSRDGGSNGLNFVEEQHWELVGWLQGEWVGGATVGKD